jgi:hypothetical protein
VCETAKKRMSRFLTLQAAGSVPYVLILYYFYYMVLASYILYAAVIMYMYVYIHEYIHIYFLYIQCIMHPTCSISMDIFVAWL